MNQILFRQRLRRHAVVAIVAVFGLSGVPMLSAQSGAKVVKQIDVEYVGDAAISKDRVLANLSTKVGDTISPAKIDEDIKNLYASGDFENIRVLSKEVPGGVALKLVVQTRALLGEVRFTGNSLFDSDKLTKQADLRVNRPIDEAKIREGREKILESYRKRGFPEAVVNYQVSAPDRRGYSVVTFSIDEGGQAKLRKVDFVGNTVFTSAELRKEMEQRPKSVLNPFAKQARIDDSTISGDIRAIEDFYQNKGYLGAHVQNVSRIRADDGKHVDLVITINEGEPYTIGNVSVSGVQAVSLEGDLLPYLKTKSGGYYSGQFLKDDIALIGSQYGMKGFADVQVTPKLDPAGSNAVSVNFIVSEGRAFNVGQINIEGNTKTKDHVIRRELAIKPGEPYNKELVEASRRRLMNLNYFSTVDVMPVDTSYDLEKDLIINVTEKPTGTINFGAGFSSIDDLVGFMEISQTNFDIGNWPSLTGGGQRFRLGVRVGTKRRDISLALTEPWFMGKRLALTGELFYRDLLFLSDYYDQTNYGGALSLRKPLTEHVYAQAGFRPQMVEISVDRNASEALLEEEGDFFYNPLEADLVYDSRDNLFLPRQGNRASLGVEAGVGGDVSAAKFSASGSHHMKVPEFGFVLGKDPIINVNGRWSTVSDADHIFVREFLGGANNLRGFEYRDVGPKDENGEALGGDEAWYASAEYTFLIIDKIRGAAFYDVGEVSGGPGTLGGGVNSNWGFGVRLFMLGDAPIRLDYGIPIQTDQFNDDSGRFNFTIGYQF
jgi:outer membrane protein insertion porin family